jgi:hypothetical protein
MDEGDFQSVQSAPRLLIDQRHALCGELGQRSADVVDLEGDVVNARAALLWPSSPRKA